MILFADDWSKFPSAFPNTETTNRTFVRQALVYREMGIKNHAFILALVNKELVGIDPFSMELTSYQMKAIAIECRMNPWFFFREVARAPAIASTTSSIFEANRGNIALFWSFFNHIMIILIQCRQTGKSYSTDVLMTLLMNVLCQNTKINLLTKDDDLRRKNIERLKEIRAELPRYLQQQTREDANNGEELTTRSLKNIYSTHVPQTSKKRAYNMGRGLTSPIFHIDEPPFQANIGLALPAALAATGAANEKARFAGTPHGVILTTTAGMKDDPDGRFVYDLLAGGIPWSEAFFDLKNREELIKVVRKGSSGQFPLINATFSHRQLGKTDEWLDQRIQEALSKGEDADRDFRNKWTSGSDDNPIPVVLLEKIVKSEVEPKFTEIHPVHGYITRWYIQENEIENRMENGKFIFSMDTSEASGGDDISLLIIDIETLETIAAGKYNETNLITFSEWVCDWFIRFSTITGIIERRSTGSTLLDYLLLRLPEAGIDPFERLFNRVVNDYDEFPERYREIKQPMNRRPSDIYVRLKKTFGFATSGSGETSRTGLYSVTLQNAAKRGADCVKDRILIDQLKGLVTKNGRIDHDSGKHDDMVIAWLLGNWLLTLGRNLAFYGIDVRRVMSKLSSAKQEKDSDYWYQLEQQTIRDKMEELYSKLSSEDDIYVSMRIEHELRSLDRKLIVEVGEVFSVDELIRQASEKKRAKYHHFSQRQSQPYRNTLESRHGVLSDRPMTHRDMNFR